MANSILTEIYSFSKENLDRNKSFPCNQKAGRKGKRKVLHLHISHVLILKCIRWKFELRCQPNANVVFSETIVQHCIISENEALSQIVHLWGQGLCEKSRLWRKIRICMQWMWSLVEWPIYSLPGLNNIYIHPQHFLFSLWRLDFSRLLSRFQMFNFWILSQRWGDKALRLPSLAHYTNISRALIDVLPCKSKS